MDFVETWICVIVAVIVTAWVTCIVVEHDTNVQWEKACVKQNVAEYNKTNGQWQWIIEKTIFK